MHINYYNGIWQENWFKQILLKDIDITGTTEVGSFSIYKISVELD